MRGARVAGRWIEEGLVRFTGVDGALHAVVRVEDEEFGAEVAVALDVVTLHDRKGLHDVLHVVAGDAVEMEEGGVELCAEMWAPRLVPSLGRSNNAKIPGEAIEIIRRVGQFGYAEGDPIPMHGGRVPFAARFKLVGGEDGELLQVEVGERSASELLAGNVVEDEGGQVAVQSRDRTGSTFRCHEERKLVPHTYRGKQTRDHRPFVRVSADVAPAEEPVVGPAVGEAGVDFGGGDPVAGEDDVGGVLQALEGDVGEAGALGARRAVAVVAVAVVEVVHHLRFVERQVARVGAVKDVALQLPALGFELLTRVEEAGVARHVEQTLLEGQAPGVLLGWPFSDQDGNSLVNSLGDLGVTLGAENRAGAGVWVQQRDVVCREGEVAPVVTKV